MSLIVVPIYAALLTFIFILLSFRTILGRRRTKVSIGSGGDKALERTARVHANFAEYTPLALLLLAFLEMQMFPALFLHFLGLALLTARSLHAYGVSNINETFIFRIAGTLTTFGVLIISALCLLWHSIGTLV
jgi:uncharacterized membrane protein YecN with MAPEG domain